MSERDEHGIQSEQHEPSAAETEEEHEKVDSEPTKHEPRAEREPLSIVDIDDAPKEAGLSITSE